MSILGSITYETKKEELLDPEKTKGIAKSCSEEPITEVKSNLIDKLASEKTPGFSPEALYIQGYSPLNDLATDISTRMTADMNTIETLSGQILSEGNQHTKAEVEEFHDAVKSKYSKDVTSLKDAVAAYNVEVDNHNTEENNKSLKNENYTPNIFKKIQVVSGGTTVDDIVEQKLNREPNPLIQPRCDSVKSAELNLQNSWNNYVEEYKKVIDWKDLNTQQISSSATTDSSTELGNGTSETTAETVSNTENKSSWSAAGAGVSAIEGGVLAGTVAVLSTATGMLTAGVSAGYTITPPVIASILGVAAQAVAVPAVLTGAALGLGLYTITHIGDIPVYSNEDLTKTGDWLDSTRNTPSSKRPI